MSPLFDPGLFDTGYVLAASNWANLQAVLRAHLVAAGAAVTPAIPVVRLAGPQAPVRCITCEYEGDETNPFTGGNTLSQRQTGERLEIKVWLPVASFDQAAAEATETMLMTIKEQVKARIAADENLGGYCMAVHIGNSRAAWEQWPNREGAVTVLRTLTIPIVVALADVSPIAN
jgi:hypothetical protein